MNMITPFGREGGNIYLASFLASFAEWLDADDVTEILVNHAGEVWVERSGVEAMERHVRADVDEQLLERLAQQIARISHQAVSRESPLLAATLPGGARVQMILPPATRSGPALAIRKHVLRDLSLDGLLADCLPPDLDANMRDDAAIRADLAGKLAANDLAGFLRTAVSGRKTILISGGTSSGKTTMLNALLKEIPASARIVAIEDTPEIRLDHPNALGLVAVAGEQGEARIGTNDLLHAALRMRPDRLIVGELRGAECVSFLRAINTGHPGSLSTIHASSTTGAFEQIALLCMQAGLGLSRSETIDYARSMIDIVVQLHRVNGVRQITAIEAPSLGR
jgi:type IV secretion system protein VirB11